MAILLVVVFIVVPVIEIAVIIEVGHLIGPLWTVGLLLTSAVVGSWLLRREGRRAWHALQEALGQARIPTREVADGALVIFGAALMVAPGFLTDLAGMLCLLPPTRAILRRLLTTAAMRRLLVRAGEGQPVRVRKRAGRPDPPARPPGPGPTVIDGEVEP